MSLPEIQRLRPEEVRTPYHKLLVNSSDMTPTLEAFYGQPMAISVLSRERRDHAYFREVVLRPAEARLPVEYGVIHIHLDRLPAPAAARVLEERRPLGNILHRENVPHLSWPQAFFRVRSDSHISGLLGLREPVTLYGRRNVLLDGERRLLAEVIEVLAPVTNHPEVS